jgi:hypothetical protein
MRLLFLAPTLLGLSCAAVAAEPQPAGDMTVINPLAPTSSNCPPISRYEALKRGSKLGLRNLNELPGADMYKAVYRRIGGCVGPIIVRYNLGGQSERKPAKP